MNTAFEISPSCPIPSLQIEVTPANRQEETQLYSPPAYPLQFLRRNSGPGFPLCSSVSSVFEFLFSAPESPAPPPASFILVTSSYDPEIKIFQRRLPSRSR